MDQPGAERCVGLAGWIEEIHVSSTGQLKELDLIASISCGLGVGARSFNRNNIVGSAMEDKLGYPEWQQRPGRGRLVSRRLLCRCAAH